jgi:hypothetical protein
MPLGATADSYELATLADRLCNSGAPSRFGFSSDAPGRIRTCDLSLRRRTLYPLSYGRGERAVYPLDAPNQVRRS